MPGHSSNNSTTTNHLSLEGRDMATYHRSHLAVTPHSMSKTGSNLQESQHFSNGSSIRDGSQKSKRNLIILIITSKKMKTID